MSRPKNILGLKNVLIGPVGADGGMGTTLTEILGATVKGSASLVLNEGTTTDVEIEETDVPYDQLDATPAKWLYQGESYNVSAKALSELGGGTLTTGTAGAPDSIDMDIPSAVEVSVATETQNGAKLDIARMKLNIYPQFDFKKEAFGRVIFKGTPLKPTKAGTPTIKKTDAPSA
ncbi:hypothetical protein [Sphingobacterium kyonggiense]